VLKSGLYIPFRCHAEAVEGGAFRVRVEGEIDVATVDELARCLAVARRAAPRAITIDLRAVTFIGSSGLNLLFQELPARVSNGAWIEVQTAPAVDRVLRLARFSDPFAGWGPLFGPATRATPA
jgi:anti-anti-sigma factor